MKTNKQRHFIFGYGSLICPISRCITSPSIAKHQALPVTLNNVKRSWSARTTSGYTAMGVRFQEGTKCTGVLLEVNGKELLQLDNREKAYNRLPFPLNEVEKVPFLIDTDSEDEAEHVVFQEAYHEKLNVWIYVQKNGFPSDFSHPIPQSYVDIILRGCLTVSPDFARSVISTTSGWQSDHNVSNWVDDRSDPIYIRADPEYSLSMGNYLDELLEECIPLAFSERVEYEASAHRKAREEDIRLRAYLNSRD